MMSLSYFFVILFYEKSSIRPVMNQQLDGVIPSYVSISSCVLMCLLFVCSLYFQPAIRDFKSRNHPEVIVFRFKAVTASCVIGFLWVAYLGSKYNHDVMSKNQIQPTDYF